jgi:hypothetical protein
MHRLLYKLWRCWSECYLQSWWLCYLVSRCSYLQKDCNLWSSSSGEENCFTQYIYQSYGQNNPENWVGCVASPRNFYVTSPTGKNISILEAKQLILTYNHSCRSIYRSSGYRCYQCHLCQFNHPWHHYWHHCQQRTGRWSRRCCNRHSRSNHNINSVWKIHQYWRHRWRCNRWISCHRSSCSSRCFPLSPWPTKSKQRGNWPRWTRSTSCRRGSWWSGRRSCCIYRRQ